MTPQQVIDATETLERAAESLARLGDLPNAIALWALVLRLRVDRDGWTDADYQRGVRARERFDRQRP